VYYEVVGDAVSVLLGERGRGGVLMEVSSFGVCRGEIGGWWQKGAAGVWGATVQWL